MKVEKHVYTIQIEIIGEDIKGGAADVVLELKKKYPGATITAIKQQDKIEHIFVRGM